MEEFSVGYCDLVGIEILQGNILTSNQDGSSICLAENVNSRLEGLQGALVILMQGD